MRVLGAAAGFVLPRSTGKVFLAIGFQDFLARGGDRLSAHTYRVGSDVGHQTLAAFLAQLHPLVQALYNLHGAGGGVVQLAAGFLLQGGGGKGRRR